LPRRRRLADRLAPEYHPDRAVAAPYGSGSRV